MTQSSRLAENARARPSIPPKANADAAIPAIRGRLVGLAVKLVWNRDDAEEIVQEAFKIAAAKGPASNEARYEPWMVRTVGNLCLNLRRRRRPESVAAWLDVEAGESPAARLERAERMEAVRIALQNLPDQQRIAVVLRTMEHADYARIADVLGVSESAARTHVHLGRRRLAATLSQSNADGVQGGVT